MGWAVGYDSNWNRWIGYGVPSTCDHPECGEEIDRGLAHVCSEDIYGGEHGCGLFFCVDHLSFGEDALVCGRCLDGREPFEPTPDTAEWVKFLLTDESWADWRRDNPEEVKAMTAAMEEAA